jgi:hypothetical protein
VLLLDDADHLQRALLLELSSRLVPPGHVNAAARSPRSEDVQDDFPTAKVRNREWTAVVQRWQRQVGKRPAFFDP